MSGMCRFRARRPGERHGRGGFEPAAPVPVRPPARAPIPQRRRKSTLTKILLVAAAVLAAAPVSAQNANPPSAPSADKINVEPTDADRDSFTIGVAGAVLPSYEGSDDYIALPGATARGKLKGFNFFTRGTQLYIDATPDRSPGLQVDIGPVVSVNLNRSFWIRDAQVRALGGRKVALELGGFAGLSRTGLIAGRAGDRLSANVTIVGDVTGVHRSFVVTPLVEYGVPLGRRLYVVASASADYAGGGYARSYFGVDAQGALRSGLPAFAPREGSKNVTFGALGSYVLRGDFLHGTSLFATGSYSRLLNDFARSPVVSVAGDRNQLFGVAGVAFSF